MESSELGTRIAGSQVRRRVRLGIGVGTVNTRVRHI
jgi:hypothetical protein